MKDSYWLCGECANKKGGEFPAEHVCTVTVGVCFYCEKPDVTLIPWVDFNWPKDSEKNKKAKQNRD